MNWLGLVVGGLLTWAGYESYEKWKKSKQSYSLTGGHNVSVQLLYTGAPPAGPVAASDLQGYLNATSGQGGQLLTLIGSPSLDATNKIVSYSATYSGPTGTIPGSALIGQWPAAWGTVSLENVADTGTTAAPTTSQALTPQEGSVF